jgi:YVTN family beta-propeller protein
VTRVDVRTLRVAGTTDTGGIPISVGYSGLSGSVYVAEAKGGELIVLGGNDFSETARVTMKPGLGPLRFTPDGRYAMVVNPSEDKVYVVDVSSNSVVHQINVTGQPYQLTFTRAFGYVRSLASERVTMINLATLGAGRNPIVQSFAAGSVPRRYSACRFDCQGA